MSQFITRVEPDQIKQLDSTELVRLLHRLLHCEALAMELNQPGILVPYEITVPDGGSDGQWKPKDINAAFLPNEFIPRSWTRYQCKAEHLTAGKCRDEVAPKNAAGVYVVKPRVKEVLEAGACFAFFSNDHEIKPNKDQDIDTVVRMQLRKAGFTPAPNAVIEFYGCNRIADWTNKFPSAVRFVHEICHALSGPHYRNFDGWAKLRDVAGNFFSNAAVDQKILAIRQTLLASTSRIIRITGLSGVGKSRLVHEAIKPSSDNNPLQNSLSASCIYLSFETVSTGLIDFIGHLADNQYSAIVVVDDCPPAAHDQIVNLASNSSLTIITIFHEHQAQRVDSHPLHIDPEEMGEVVEQILRSDHNLVARGDGAIKAVAAFAQGFPQIAKLIVEFRRAPTTEELNDRAKLFQKLLSQGNDPDKSTLRVAQALSLFRTIGGSEAKLNADLKTIREIFCSELTEIEFHAEIARQKKRRIVQQIADTMVLAPRPLGVALAADFVSFFPSGRWRKVIDLISEGSLLSEFLRRIEELEFSGQAEELGKMLLEIGLPFNDAEYLLTGKTASQIFRVLTVLNPSTALKLAKRALNQFSLKQLHRFTDSRRDLVLALEVLVWEPTTFRDAAELLLKLAAAENEVWANNATGAFKQLFQLHLSGTKVPAMDRLDVIRGALRSGEPSIQAVAFAALGSALEFRFFSRNNDTTLAGKRDARLDWQPMSNREALNYWRECYHILYSRIIAGEEDKDEAKRTLEKEIAVILQTPLLMELEPQMRHLCQHFRHFWPEVKTQVRIALDIGKKNQVEEHIAALNRLKDALTPLEGDMPARIKDLVSTPGWNHRTEADGSLTDTSREEAERFATDIATKAIDVTPYLPQLLSGEQQQAFLFGSILGRDDPRAQSLMEAALAIWPTITKKERNNNFICGLMWGLSTQTTYRAALLDRLATNSELIDLLAPLTASIQTINQEEFVRIRRAIVDSRLEPVELRHLLQGLPLKNLPESFLASELEMILKIKPNAALPIFELLFSHYHTGRRPFSGIADFFGNLLLNPELPLSESHFAWMWQEACVKIIQAVEDVNWMRSLSRFICETLLKAVSWIDTDQLSVVTSKLFEKVPVETWASFSEALTVATAYQKYVIVDFLGKSGGRFDESNSPLWTLPEDQFRAWLQKNKQLAPLILDRISLYTSESLADGQQIFKWHPHALVLLSESINEKKLADALITNLLSFGSSGSRIPYLEKRLALVRDLAKTGDPKLARIAQKVEECLTAELEMTTREELNRHAQLG